MYTLCDHLYFMHTGMSQLNIKDMKKLIVFESTDAPEKEKVLVLS
jgi:hypothetical protein